MDIAQVKELGAFGIMALTMLYGGKILLNWFTRTVDTKDVMISKQQEQQDVLIAQLVTVMRETQEAHQKMVDAMASITSMLADAFARTTTEHSAIVACINAAKSPSQWPPTPPTVSG
jgi:vacuolar-type H+-ATPase subunit D/Vma8